ncbi:MAG: hypothetical protein V4689_21335 [Verrucomicrobiota bacterium]
MIDHALARIFHNQWMVLMITTLLFFLIAELAYRLGRVYRKRNPDASASDGGVQGAVLGLLGLLLGFTFAMAVGRYDTRHTLNVDEANSIGTTWLRSDFLPSPQQDEVKTLLRRYAELKVEAPSVRDRTPQMAEMRAEIGRIQSELWTAGSKAAAAVPTPVTVSFITTLNETIDLDSSNLTAMRNRVPGAVWLLLLVVASSGSWVSGYGCGLAGMRSTFSQLIFPILIGVVITLIADIDRPHMGVIRVNKGPMNNLLESMQSGITNPN